MGLTREKSYNVSQVSIRITRERIFKIPMKTILVPEMQLVESNCSGCNLLLDISFNFHNWSSELDVCNIVWHQHYFVISQQLVWTSNCLQDNQSLLWLNSQVVNKMDRQFVYEELLAGDSIHQSGQSMSVNLKTKLLYVQHMM